MVRKFMYIAMVSTAASFLLWGGDVACQEPVAAQEFMAVLQNLVATMIENMEDTQGRITRVELQVGVVYTRDSEGRVKIVAVPQDTNYAEAAVHKLTLHWIPPSPKGVSPAAGGSLPSSMQSFPAVPGLMPKHQEQIQEILKEKGRTLPKAGGEEKRHEENR